MATYSATVYQPIQTRSAASAISSVLGTTVKPTTYNAVDLNKPITMPDVQVGGKSAYDYAKEGVRTEAERNKQLRNEALQTRMKSMGLSGAAMGKLQQQGTLESDIASQGAIADINKQQISDIYAWSKDKTALEIQQEMNRVNTDLQNRGYSNQERQAYITALMNDIQNKNTQDIQQSQFASSQKAAIDMEKLRNDLSRELENEKLLRNLKVETAYNQGAAGAKLPDGATESEKFAYEKGKAGAAYDDVQRQLKTEDEIKKAKITAIANAYQQGVDPLGMADVFDEVLGYAGATVPTKTGTTGTTGTDGTTGTQTTEVKTRASDNQAIYPNGLESPYPNERKSSVLTTDVVADAEKIWANAQIGDKTAQQNLNAMMSKAYKWTPNMTYDARGFWATDERRLNNAPKKGDIIIYNGTPYAVISDTSMKRKYTQDTDTFKAVNLKTGKVSDANITGKKNANIQFNI